MWVTLRLVGVGLVAATSACGRVGFDATRDGAGAGDAASCEGVDLQTDEANCGACGHDCAGGDCTGGQCQAILLASGQGPLRGIVVDATHVYWTGQGGVRRVGKAGGASELVATFSGTGFRMVEVDGLLYTVTRNTGVVARAAKTSGGAAAEIIDTNQGDVAGIDADGAVVYWSTYPAAGNIFRKSIGGARTELLPAPTDRLTDLELRGTTLYYLIDQGGLWRIDVGGSAPVEVAPGVGSWELELDGDDAFVASAAHDRILRCSLSGAVPPCVELAPAVDPWGIEVDATHVYFGNELGDTIARAPRTGGAMEVLATTDRPVGIAVDADAVYWTTYDAGEIWKLAK